MNESRELLLSWKANERVGEAVTIRSADWQVNLWFDKQNDKSSKDHNYPPVNDDRIISNLLFCFFFACSLTIRKRMKHCRGNIDFPIDHWSSDSHSIVLFCSLRTRIIDRLYSIHLEWSTSSVGRSLSGVTSFASSSSLSRWIWWQWIMHVEREEFVVEHAPRFN